MTAKKYWRHKIGKQLKVRERVAARKKEKQEREGIQNNEYKEIKIQIMYIKEYTQRAGKKENTQNMHAGINNENEKKKNKDKKTGGKKKTRRR